MKNCSNSSHTGKVKNEKQNDCDTPLLQEHT